jgi:hypothetical protein
MGGGYDNNGEVDLNDVWSSSNLLNWMNISPNDPLSLTKWSPRRLVSNVQYFNGQLWVIGGESGSNNFHEIWSSLDGINWNLVNSSPPWAVGWVDEGQTIVLNNKIWVIIFGNNSSVWSSPDGINWTQATANTPWGYRNPYTYTFTSFNNKMWVLGGSDFNGTYNDVWSSSNGVNWTLETPNTAWSPRSTHQTVVFNNKLWVISGTSNSLPLSDVWSSPDGINNWTQETSNAIWGGMSGLEKAIVFNNKIYLIGGQSLLLGMASQIWSSSDGITWTHVDTDINTLGIQDAPWHYRSYLSVVAVPPSFGLPDLTITNLTFRNQPIHVSTTNPYVYYDVTVKNSSTIPVVLPATGNTFQINLTSIPSAVPSGDLATITVGTPITLQPGQSHTFSNVSTRYDSRIRATARTYRITAKADALNLITELNETNNTYATNLTIIP